jgi:hypothetical protein
MTRFKLSDVAPWLVVLIAFAVFAHDAVGQSRPLPPGHPPTDRGNAPPPAPPPGSGTGRMGLTWTAPSSWIAETPKTAMRRAQYRIDGKGGLAECIVFYFGPGEGGGVKANVERWAAQFRRADGSAIGNALKTREIKVGDIPVTLVEITGTYVGGMGGGPGGPEKPDQMMLAAIAEGRDANWFFRALGPRATLEPVRADFEKMARSIKPGADRS